MEIQVIEKTNERINRETGRRNDNYSKKYPFSILYNNNRKIVGNFLEKLESILKENTTETMVNKLEKNKEKINKNSLIF